MRKVKICTNREFYFPSYLRVRIGIRVRARFRVRVKYA